MPIDHNLPSVDREESRRDGGNIDVNLRLLLHLHNIRLRGSFAGRVADCLAHAVAHTGPLAARSRSKRRKGHRRLKWPLRASQGRFWMLALWRTRFRGPCGRLTRGPS